jgi:hypothetical protein
MSSVVQRSAGGPYALPSRSSRAVVRVCDETTVRLARVQAEAIVQAEKIHEIDHLAREAMSGQALLHQWAATLSNGDAFTADDMRFFLDTAKLGKGEIIADTIATYCREGRR